MIYLRLEVGKSKVSLRNKIAFHIPFSVYLGWITIASIANVATTLVSFDWDGFGMTPDTWATLVVVIALAISLTVIIKRKDVFYGLVIIWALAGISVKQSTNQAIVAATEVSILIIAITLIAILISKIRNQPVVDPHPEN
ncbi:MAG: hypothetical protein N3D12_05715 [Candidatus Methanomethyliaceae archaeon]|nr:hypothetical protein [Candidatus Methanomethyliaceae archaeon]